MPFACVGFVSCCEGQEEIASSHSHATANVQSHMPPVLSQKSTPSVFFCITDMSDSIGSSTFCDAPLFKPPPPPPSLDPGPWITVGSR